MDVSTSREILEGEASVIIFKIKWRIAWLVRDWRGPIGQWGNGFVWANSYDAEEGRVHQ